MELEEALVRVRSRVSRMSFDWDDTQEMWLVVLISKDGRVFPAQSESFADAYGEALHDLTFSSRPVA